MKIRWWVGGVLCCMLISLTASASGVKSFVESDLRYAAPGKEGTESGVLNRFENTAGLSGYFDGESSGVSVNLKLSYFGGSQDNYGDLVGLDPEHPDRFRLEAQALYWEAFDIIEGVDLRIGRQVVEWGSADMFNPTNVVNALDLEDPIKFGARVPNDMGVLTWNAGVTVEGESGSILFDELAISLLVIPVFRPSWLPKSGQAAFTDPSLMNVQVDSRALRTMSRLNGAFADAGGDLEYDLVSERRKMNTDNIQYGARMTANVFGLSLGASYYRGFSDIVYADDIGIAVGHPNPADANALDGNMKMFNLAENDDVDSLISFIENNTFGIKDKLADATVTTNIILKNPRIDMVGGDLSTSLDSLGGIGLWVEFAYFMHDKLVRDIEAGKEMVLETIDQETSFWKLTAGMDYTIAKWWYVNAQYMHGFVDEFGSERLNDYVVAVNDFKFFADKLLARFVVMHQFQDGSTVIYPQFTGTFIENTELTLGGMVYLGEKVSKFGTPAAGPNLLFARARISF